MARIVRNGLAEDVGLFVYCYIISIMNGTSK